jgi:hypothetical protein
MDAAVVEAVLAMVGVGFTPPPMVVVTCICLTCVYPPAVRIEAAVVAVAVPTTCGCCCCCMLVISCEVVTTVIAIWAVTVLGALVEDGVGSMGLPPLRPINLPHAPNRRTPPPLRPMNPPQTPPWISAPRTSW